MSKPVRLIYNIKTIHNMYSKNAGVVWNIEKTIVDWFTP